MKEKDDDMDNNDEVLKEGGTSSGQTPERFRLDRNDTPPNQLNAVVSGNNTTKDNINTNPTPSQIRLQALSVSGLLLVFDYRAKRLDLNALKSGDMWEVLNLLPFLEGLEVAFRSVKVGGGLTPKEACDLVVQSWS